MRTPQREMEPSPLATRQVENGGLTSARSGGGQGLLDSSHLKVGATAAPEGDTARRNGSAERGGATSALPQVAVAIVEDHPIVREGLRLLLSSTPSMRIVGETSAGEDALRGLASRAPDVVLFDLDISGEEVLGALPRVARAALAAKVLALTASHDPVLHGAVLHAGARGLVTKDSPVEQILKAIRKVSAGELWFERHVLDAALARKVARRNGHDELTERELEVVALIGLGLKNCEIACRLEISNKTVRNHLSSIFAKLQVSDRLELLVHAYQLGLVSIPRRPAV